MKELLNTLYVTRPDAYLSKDGNNVVVSEKGNEIFRVPIINLSAIRTFGYQGASPGLMSLCSENNVDLVFFSPNGKFVARIQGPVHGNVLLRHRQYEISKDKDRCLHLAQNFVMGKIHNSKITLSRFVRDYPENNYAKCVEKVVNSLGFIRKTVSATSNIDELRGVEGNAANKYFGVFDHLILNKDVNFKFNGRVKRPPTDIVNSMLSMGYSLLAHECSAALEGVGLDPATGFMHALRPGRMSLALDIMEEMRSYMVDRFVLTLINTKQMNVSDFKVHQNGNNSLMPVIFSENGLKKFITAWQVKKQTEITHPFLNEKIKVGLLPHVQAILLARYLRGDLDDYPMFLNR